ncbi:OLC1v1031279C1 [Oldenlandia corymbosa var. corymbosa]|uniref:OLC1v1031279C1 n=1 Tax=Oldenlandia corymbosa var. corymbosa TaxID=529605 RepID=A0AAV1CL17_OLDCO|nr:OLC1v1031279C1 [Oldenlandia corymbosa var. corymbosa]
MEIERVTAGTVTGSGLQGGDLPEWFLTELLSRLPVEDVFRFNCVSKKCAAFISDPSFRRSYFSKQPSPPQDRFVFFPTRVRRREGNRDGIGLKYPERHLFALPAVPFEWEGSSSSRKATRRNMLDLVESWTGGGSFYSVADDKGFLLVGWVDTVGLSMKQDRCLGEFFVCSAITHQWFSLPSSPPTPFVIESVSFVTQLDESGSFLNSYRVALIDFTVENIEGTFVPDYVDIQVFSSEIGAWAPVRLQIGRPYMFYRWQRAVSLNTTVYWTDPVNGGILAYDPFTNQHRVIEPPSLGYSGGFSGGYSSCGVYQGRLKYFEKLKSLTNGHWEVLKIWQLQEDDHWGLQHSIRMEDDHVPDFDFEFKTEPNRLSLSTSSFLSFDQRNPDVVYLNMSMNAGVISYHVGTQSMELLDPRSSLKGDFSTLCEYRWFLLKLPPWPVFISPHLLSKRADE